MAINSLKPGPLYFYTQSNSVISLNALKEKSEEPLHLTDINTKFDVIPEIRVNNNRLNVYTQNQITNPGFYKLTHKGQDLQSVAFNYNRLESGLEFFTNDDIEKSIAENNLISFKNLVASEKSLTASVAEISGNVKLWK